MNPYLQHRRKAFKQTGDPFWANVVFLQNFQGTNGSMPATDQSQYAHALTWNGDAVISTAQSPFAGGSSADLDGSGDFLSVPDNDSWDMGSGNFTIEMFFRVRSYGKLQFGAYRQQLMGNYGGATAGWGFSLSGTVSSYTQILAGTGDTSIVAASHNTTLNTWHHIAWTKSGSSHTLWMNGASIGTGTQLAMFNSSAALLIGRNSVATAWDFDGNVGPIRITKGIARYTTNFTPPTAPFPTGP